MKLLSKNIEEKREKRYNIHGLSCIDSFPEANRRGGGAVPFSAALIMDRRIL